MNPAYIVANKDGLFVESLQKYEYALMMILHETLGLSR